MWGPSGTDLLTVVRQPEEPGWWEGHAGTFVYEDYGIVLAPYVWYPLGGDPGPDPGAPVETGWKDFPGTRMTVGGIWFYWYDPEYHTAVVNPGIQMDVDVQGHSRFLWVCSEEVTPPPDAVYPPEPGTWVLLLSGIGAITLFGRLRWPRHRKRMLTATALI